MLQLFGKTKAPIQLSPGLLERLICRLLGVLCVGVRMLAVIKLPC
jgi:hypothetical protein